MRAVHVSQEVGLDDAAVRLDRGFVEQAHRADADVVEPHVHMTEMGDGVIGERADRRGVGDVRRHDQGPTTRRFALVSDRLQGAFVAGGQHDVVPALGEGEGGGSADAAGGTGDHHDLGSQPLSCERCR